LFAGESSSNLGNEKSEDCYGASDIWIIKTDFDGNKIWDKTIGSVFSDNFSDILFINNRIIVIGSTSDQTGSGNLGIFANGILDSFIASLEPSNGNLFEVISYDKVITKMIAISDSILFFGGFDHEIKELWIGTI